MTKENINFKATLVRNPIDLKSNDWQEKSYQWNVEINDQHFDFYTGSGLINENKTPKPPTLNDVLYALTSDSDACDMSFEDWCNIFEYDTDSRKALNIYLLCQENTKKLLKTGIDIDKEKERLQDY